MGGCGGRSGNDGLQRSRSATAPRRSPRRSAGRSPTTSPSSPAERTSSCSGSSRTRSTTVAARARARRARGAPLDAGGDAARAHRGGASRASRPSASCRTSRSRCGAGSSVTRRGGEVPEEIGTEIARLLGLLGTAIELPEEQMEAAMAVMSCSPAYVAMVAEVLTDAGIREGLDPEHAALFVARDPRRHRRAPRQARRRSRFAAPLRRRAAPPKPASRRSSAPSSGPPSTQR